MIIKAGDKVWHNHRSHAGDVLWADEQDAVVQWPDWNTRDLVPVSELGLEPPKRREHREYMRAKEREDISDVERKWMRELGERDRKITHQDMLARFKAIDKSTQWWRPS